MSPPPGPCRLWARCGAAILPAKRWRPDRSSRSRWRPRPAPALDRGLGSDQGVLHHLLDGGGVLRAERRRVVEARHDRRELVDVAAGAAGEVVREAALVEPGEDLLLVGHGEAAGVGLRPGDGHADDEVRPAGLADAVRDLGHEAQPVLQAAAPGIVAPVGQRRPELVDQAGIAGEEVDPVEAALLVAHRLVDEGLDEFADLGLAHGVAAPGIVVADLAGGGPVGRPGVVLIAVGAHVIDLVAHDGAVAVALVGDLAEVGNHRVVGLKLPRVNRRGCGGVGPSTIMPRRRGAAPGR